MSEKIFIFFFIHLLRVSLFEKGSNTQINVWFSLIREVLSSDNKAN